MEIRGQLVGISPLLPCGSLTQTQVISHLASRQQFVSIKRVTIHHSHKAVPGVSEFTPLCRTPCTLANLSLQWVFRMEVDCTANCPEDRLPTPSRKKAPRKASPRKQGFSAKERVFGSAIREQRSRGRVLILDWMEEWRRRKRIHGGC